MTLRAQRDALQHQCDEAIAERFALQSRIDSQEQQLVLTFHRQPDSPARGPRGRRTATPYSRPPPVRTGPSMTARSQAPAPVILDPDSLGDMILALFPATGQPMRMHARQPNYNVRYPCPTADYRWKTDGGVEVIGLPRTQAGTPYIPNETGIGWHTLEHSAKTKGEVLRRIDLLFHNRQEELWRAAGRSAFEFRRLAEPLPDVVVHFLHLNAMRKSAWSIINDGLARRAPLSIVPLGCQLHSAGYGGLYTPDIHIWAFIHAAADVDTAKLTAWTKRTTTNADLRKLLKDALCSSNYFEIKPSEASRGTYQLPHLTHYTGPVDMDSVVKWLQDQGVTPYMVHAYFRPYLHRVYNTPRGGTHQVFAPDSLLPGEAVAPPAHEALINFPSDRAWTPSRGPRNSFYPPVPTVGATANAPSAPPDSSVGSPHLASASLTPEDSDMLDSEATPANASTAASDSSTG